MKAVDSINILLCVVLAVVCAWAVLSGEILFIG